jgi:hypothetical protein
MSVNQIHINNRFNHLFTPPAQARNQMSDEKIKKIALTTLGTVAAAGGAALVGVSCAAIIPPAFALLSIPLFLSAGISLYFGITTLDYNNPEDLEKMRATALGKTFTDIINEHGLDRALQYNIVSLDDLRGKFQQQFENQGIAHILSLRNIRNPNSFTALALNTLIELGFTSKAQLHRKVEQELRAKDLLTVQRDISREHLEILLNSEVISYRAFNAITELYTESHQLVSQSAREIQRISARYPRRHEMLLRQNSAQADRIQNDATMMFILRDPRSPATRIINDERRMRMHLVARRAQSYC